METERMEAECAQAEPETAAAQAAPAGAGPREDSPGAEELKKALAAARSEVARLRAEGALRQRLLAEGALPEAVTLLCSGADPEDEDPIPALKKRYGFLFRRTEAVPTPAVSPPELPGGERVPTGEELARMSLGEINRRWEQVRAMLGRMR